MKRSRIAVNKLGLGQRTSEGSYWAEVDGEKIGEKGRAFWDTKAEASRAAIKYLALKEGK